MSEPFLGEIRVVSFQFAPKGWAFCNGQLLAINQNQAIFAIMGTTYGGNGTTNFALPNLMGRVPTHTGNSVSNSVVLGQSGGETEHTLTVSELPAHTHPMQAATDFANSSLPAGALPAAKPRGGRDIYAPGGGPLTALDPAAISAAGSSQPHTNMQPYLALNFIIALQGIFPSRN